MAFVSRQFEINLHFYSGQIRGSSIDPMFTINNLQLLTDHDSSKIIPCSSFNTLSDVICEVLCVYLLFEGSLFWDCL